MFSSLTIEILWPLQHFFFLPFFFLFSRRRLVLIGIKILFLSFSWRVIICVISTKSTLLSPVSPQTFSILQMAKPVWKDCENWLSLGKFSSWQTPLETGYAEVSTWNTQKIGNFHYFQWSKAFHSSWRTRSSFFKSAPSACWVLFSKSLHFFWNPLMFSLVQRTVLLLELFIATKVCGAFGATDNKQVCVPTAQHK